MKKVLLLVGALLVLATPAMAGGVNIAWGLMCWSDMAVQTNLTTFACNSNVGNRSAVISFVPSYAMPEFVGIEVYLIGQTDDPVAVPLWWSLSSTDGCRKTSLSASADFTTYAGANCFDPWYGAALGGIGAYTIDGRVASCIGAWALAAPSPLEANVEYTGARLTINNLATLGTACPGCSIGFLWGIHHFKAAEYTQYEMYYDAPPGGNQCLNWNNSIQPCAAPVPARNTTWGQVKSLYR